MKEVRADRRVPRPAHHTPGPAPVLSISIKQAFWNQIIAGVKKYELRKTPIAAAAQVAIVYVPEEKGIAGVLRLGRRISGRISTIWESLREGGVARADFENYFLGRKFGHAVHITDFERFEATLPRAALDRAGARYFPPQGVVRLSSADPIVTAVASKSFLLSRWLQESNHASITAWSDIRFRTPKLAELNEFRIMTAAVIGKNYDGIDESFSTNIVNSHRLGHDEHGLFTKSKTIWAMVLKDQTVGYMVITEKLGGSAKYGPVLLREEYQHQGIGHLARIEMDDRLRRSGIRKTYSTIPEHSEALHYLLESGYNVEAHLRRQYSDHHGELVLGRMLTETATPPQSVAPARQSAADLSVSETFDSRELTKYILGNIGQFYDGITAHFCDALTKRPKAAVGMLQSYKPRRVLVLQDMTGQVHGITICTPKRGGSVKLSPFLVNGTVDDARRLLAEAEHLSRTSLGGRRFYALIPLVDTALILMFKRSGYSAEGVLRDPYRPGVDFIVLGKLMGEGS